ncbi:unnamed protein product [Nesidiocoris tenuis]|uniref:Uncharacterized protein n=1 Tax=Nesidiocoris tenuis TaxID=355587 RepID=A0A6H5HPQ4_9HEMI|nr:unnamed protein product [Nesidiocoris tenuis]
MMYSLKNNYSLRNVGFLPLTASAKLITYFAASNIVIIERCRFQIKLLNRRFRGGYPNYRSQANQLTGEFGNKRIEWQPWRRNEKVGKELRGVESVLHFEAGIARANFRHPTFGRTGANKTSAHLMNAWICE